MEWYEFLVILLSLYVLFPMWLYICTFMIVSALNKAQIIRASESMKILKALKGVEK